MIKLDSKQIRTLWLDEPYSGFLNNTAIAMGNFDGIHLGHRKIIQSLLDNASSRNLTPVLLTFDPHPRIVFGQDFYILSTVYERELLLREFHLQMIVHIRFSKKLANIGYEEFVKNYLVNSLGMKLVVVGYDHHFGKQREGSPETLHKLGEKLGFETVVVAPVKVDGTEVKSNTIRELIQQGKIDEANKFLGHHYLVAEKVIAGRGLGSQIGYPTANLDISANKLIPPDGVYSASTAIHPQGEYKSSMVYIGRAPTFNLPTRMFETHIFDHDGSKLYGKYLSVKLIKFIRNDMTFRTVEELKAQIDQDACRVKQTLMNREYHIPIK
ncbi:hypothetical protein DRQ33_05990 [bacterium]|nr:MAG: hypothetical protein DRQ33_05990 [bacterium]